MLATRSIALLSLALATGASAHAASFSFAGHTFNQNNTPDQFALIASGSSLGGASFNAQPNRITRSVGFVALSGNANSGIVGQAGFDPSLSLGRQGFAQAGLTQSDGSNSIYASAINLPGGTENGTRRGGFGVSWTGGRSLLVGSGADIVVYESGSAGSPEALMVRARNASTGAWSDWHYNQASGFESYVDASTGGAFAFAFDFSAMGLSLGDLVSEIQVANMLSTDRIDGADGSAGTVRFDGVGNVAGFFNANNIFTAFGSSAYDADPLYIGVLGQVVGGQIIPLPTAGFMGLAGMAGLAARRRRH